MRGGKEKMSVAPKFVQELAPNTIHNRLIIPHPFVFNDFHQ